MSVLLAAVVHDDLYLVHLLLLLLLLTNFLCTGSLGKTRTELLSLHLLTLNLLSSYLRKINQITRFTVVVDWLAPSASYLESLGLILSPD